jgi:capsular polysaccharide biosynthesis protein
MEWGGSLGVIDQSGTLVEARSFGSFEGSVQPGTEDAIKPVIVAAVRSAVTDHPKGVFADAQAIARAAQAIAAPQLGAMGAHGTIAVNAVSVSEDDHARLRAAAAQAATRALAPAPFVAGQSVLVPWSDGQRYPAVVREVQPSQVLVAFANGATHWVPLHYLVPSG